MDVTPARMWVADRAAGLTAYVKHYEVQAWDPVRKRWVRRPGVEERIARLRWRLSSEVQLPELLKVFARQTRRRLRLVAVVEDAAPAACPRVERRHIANGCEWTLDVGLTVELLNAARASRQRDLPFHAEHWLFGRTRRRMVWEYRVVQD